MSRTRGFLVLGSHRCGTSMLAGLLALHGAFMGRTLPPGRNNPRGYWENMDVNEANETMLAHLQISWDWPFVLPPRWQDMLAPFEPLRARALAIFQEREIWAVKDPRLCRLLPLWLPLFFRSGSEMRAVLVFRHPEGACRSLEKRDAMSRRRALALWLHHYVDAISWLRHVPWIAVDYERMLDNPRQGMSELAEKTELGGWPRTPSDSELHEFADPGLLHHPPAPPRSDEWLETSCYALYKMLGERHLRGTDDALAQYVARLRVRLDEGRGLTLQLIHDVYAEIPRLRAYKLSVELALARSGTK